MWNTGHGITRHADGWKCYAIWIFSAIFLYVQIHSCPDDVDERIHHTVISGVPFDITVPENAELRSPVPRCLTLEKFQHLNSAKQYRWHMKGLCLADDFHHPNGSSNGQQTQTDAIILAFVRGRESEHITLCIELQLETALILPESPLAYISLALTANNASSVMEPLSCFQSLTTVALLYLQGDLLQLSGRDRCVLWHWLVVSIIDDQTLPGPLSGASKHRESVTCPGTAFMQKGFRLITLPDVLVENLVILANASAKMEVQKAGQDVHKRFGIVYRIGCGSIAPEALRLLAALEKRFRKGFVKLVDLIPNYHKKVMDSFYISKWIVGDLISAPQNKMPWNRRTVRQVRTSKSLSEPDPLVAEVLGSLDEGSGLSPDYRFPSPGSAATYYPSIDGLTKTGRRLQPISPVKITVHQITNVQFPPRTFEKLVDASNRDLVVTLYRPNLKGLSEMEIRSPDTPIERFGTVVPKDTKEWISFDAKSKIVRLRPLPQHVGDHQLVLCAVTSGHSRACEPFYVTVRRPAPFRKNFILRIPPGMFWCYRIPIYWFEELKAASFENLELIVNGDAPFSWDIQSAEICVVTMIRVEQIITLFFHASNINIAQSVEIEFRLSAKVPAVQRLISSSRLRLSLLWPGETKSYQLRELNRINATLAQALRVRVNPEVTASNLFIYDIIHLFSSANGSLPARLEFEWIFLPQGLPVDVDRDPLGELEQLRHIPRVGTLTGHQTSYLDRPNGVITLPALLNLCKSASLDGAEAALKATSDSFRPFLLDTVTMHELENSACYKAKQLTGRTPAGSSPLNSWGVGDTVTVRVMPEVISNFTVTAGVAFKKTINPEKATLLRRIQFMELVDTRGAKLGDTDWLGLTSDNSRLFGLPLKHHIRKQPYMFSLQIYSVDQKTPISVGFTVEVQDWFGADTDAETRPGYLVSGRLPNHRVRLRIMPTTTGSTWAIEPINSLDYRWHLSTAIDRFLRPHCPPPCNPDVGIWEMNKHESNAIFVVWAQLSLLMENTKLDPRIKDGDSLTSDTSSNVQSICPWEKLNRLQNLLTFAPSVVSVEKNKGLVTGYAANRQIFLAPWAAPSAPFRNHLATSGLGTVEAAVVDRIGVCARGNENKSEAFTSNLKMGQVLNTSGSSVHTFTIYTGEGFRYKIPQAEDIKGKTKEELHLYDMTGQRIGTSSWIGLEDDKVTVFGILMGNAVQSITYRFRIASDPHAQQGVTFAVFVAGSNPLLPAVYNHRVIMRFGSENGQRWVGGHSLADRWRIVLALDVFLRPQCATDPECKEDMDVLLLTFNYHANGFTVIWSEKSLLMKTSNEWDTPGTTPFNPLRQKWATRSKRSQNLYDNYHRSFKPVVSAAKLVASNVSNSQKNDRLKRSADPTRNNPVLTCPEQDIIYLERRLLGDTGYGLLPLPELTHHLKASGVGFLKEVQVERLGPCAKSLINTELYLPDPEVSTKNEPSYEPGGKITESFASGVSSFGPTQSKDRQRLVLLGTILPVCGGVICILLGILAFVWYRKRNKRGHPRLDVSSKLMDQATSPNNPETEQMLKQDRNPPRQTVIMMNNREKAGSINLRKPTNGNGPKATIHPELMGPNVPPPSKPLILPNERPPLKPPEYNLAYTDSPATSPPQYHNGTPQMATAAFPSMMSSNMMAGSSPHPVSKLYYGARPNPYRNLPPPIETKPGVPFLAPQMPYAPYKRVTGMQPDISHTLPR